MVLQLLHQKRNVRVLLKAKKNRVSFIQFTIITSNQRRIINDKNYE